MIPLVSRTLLTAFLCSIALLTRAESVFKPGDVYTMCGDSITQQGIYSSFVEDYILMCQPVRGVKTIQCGWGGTSAPHFAEHMKDTALPFSPNVASIYFGMNDGEMSPITPDIEKRYRDGLTQAVENFQKSGTRTIIIGSPGAVDSYYFKGHKATADVYNDVLGQLAEVARQVAQAKGVLFADLHTPMMDVMKKVKAARGDNFAVFGEMDGVHATPNGHLIMAYAFLKAMGFDGNIGTITYDAASGQSQATDGQRVVSCKPGEITIESSRYPYCYTAGNNHPAGPTTSVLPYLPFNDELNRYLLVVKNLKSTKAKITWGGQTKEFASADLAKGINLAAEFIDNPFVKPFADVHQAVNTQQGFEVTFVVDYMGNQRPALEKMVPSQEEAFKSIEAGYRKIDHGLQENVAAAVKPVTHTIGIEEEP